MMDVGCDGLQAPIVAAMFLEEPLTPTADFRAWNQSSPAVAPKLGAENTPTAPDASCAARQRQAVQYPSATKQQIVPNPIGEPASRPQQHSQYVAKALHNLAMGNSSNAQLIAKCGGVEPLVQMLTCGDVEQQEQAASTLWKLSESGNQVRIVDANGIEAFVRLLQTGTPKQ